MSELDEVVDKFSGFITKEQAESLLNSQYEGQPAQTGGPRKANVSARELLKSVASKKPQEKLGEPDESIVNVKEQIYRIFNPLSLNVRGRETSKRTLILGEEGFTMPLTLRDRLSDFIDINAFERGDTVVIANAVLDYSSGELRSGQNTVINRVSPSKRGVITDYSPIREELRKVDAIGRIVEISPIRHVNRLGRVGQIAVAACVITDSVNLIDASFWGSSALATANMKTNDFVKLEFCDVRMRDGKLQIYVNDDSRVLISNSFANRLLAKK